MKQANRRASWAPDRPEFLSQKVILANLTGKHFQMWKRYSIDRSGMDAKAGHASNVVWIRQRLEMPQNFGCRHVFKRWR